MRFSDHEKRSRSRSGRRDGEKSSSKRPINPFDRYWNHRDNRDEEVHERRRIKHTVARDGKGNINSMMLLRH